MVSSISQHAHFQNMRCAVRGKHLAWHSLFSSTGIACFVCSLSIPATLFVTCRSSFHRIFKHHSLHHFSYRLYHLRPFVVLAGYAPLIAAYKHLFPLSAISAIQAWSQGLASKSHQGVAPALPKEILALLPTGNCIQESVPFLHCLFETKSAIVVRQK